MMRRAERAVVLCTGIALVALLDAIARRLDLASLRSLAHAPALIAIAVVAVGANVSAVRRLVQIAAAAARLRDAPTEGERARPLPAAALRPARPVFSSSAWARASSTTQPPR